MHQRGRTQNEQDVRDVAADHIADHDARRVPPRRVQTRDQFWNRCAEADQDQSDGEFGDAQALRQRRCATYEQVTAEQQTDESSTN